MPIRGRKTLARRAVPRRDRDDAGAVEYLSLPCSQMLEPRQSLHRDLPIAPVRIRGTKTLARRAVPRRDRDDAGAVDYLSLLCSQIPAPPQSLHCDLPIAPVQIRGRKTLAPRAQLLSDRDDAGGSLTSASRAGTNSLEPSSPPFSWRQVHRFWIPSWK